MMPPEAALTAAWMRVLTLSLRHAVSMWKSTLRFVDPMICAISVDVLPRAAQVRHSISRSVSATSRDHNSVRATLARREMMTVSRMSKSIGLTTYASESS